MPELTQLYSHRRHSEKSSSSSPNSLCTQSHALRVSSCIAHKYTHTVPCTEDGLVSNPSVSFAVKRTTRLRVYGKAQKKRLAVANEIVVPHTFSSLAPAGPISSYHIRCVSVRQRSFHPTSLTLFVVSLVVVCAQEFDQLELENRTNCLSFQVIFF